MESGNKTGVNRERRRRAAALGRRGEEEACAFLLARGFVLRDRNWRGGRGGHGELDIVAVREGVWHFVEVRSRSLKSAAVLLPEESLGYAKQRSLLSAVRAYVGRHKIEAEVQVDVVAVVFGPQGPQIRYYPNAIYPQNR